jgi:EmrB/QacA subfamily drug resistance transporter
VPTQLAPITGPLLGGLLVDSVGWRWIFYVNVPVCLVALALSFRVIPDGAQRVDRRLDLLGLALLSPAIALLVFGLSRTGTPGGALPPLAAGAVPLVAFVAYALRTRSAPLIDIRLFKYRALAAASALNFVSRLSIFGASILLALYLQQARGHDALTAGLLLAPQSVGTMLALPYVGKLTDRIGARPVVLTGIAMTTLAAVTYTRLTAHTPVLVLAASMLVWGMGVAAVAVPVSAAAYDGLPPADIPGATSAITMVQTVGASVGAAVLTSILQYRLAHHPGAPALAFADTFFWVLAFTGLALVPALVLPMRTAGRRIPATDG